MGKLLKLLSRCLTDQNGISMIPFGLLAGFADDKEIRLIELAEALNRVSEVAFELDHPELYQAYLKEELFPYGCSENCYYNKK